MLADMNAVDIYVSTTGYLTQMIYICRCRENSQHYMSDNPYLNHISMDNYKQEIFPTFVLELLFYNICSLN